MGIVFEVFDKQRHANGCAQETSPTTAFANSAIQTRVSSAGKYFAQQRGYLLELDQGENEWFISMN